MLPARRLFPMREAAEPAGAAAEHAHHDRTGHADALHSAPAVVQQTQKNEGAGKGQPAQQRRAAEDAAEQIGHEPRRGTPRTAWFVVRRAGVGFLHVVHGVSFKRDRVSTYPRSAVRQTAAS